MHITFMGARLPLTKTFVRTGSRITATPYPHVTRVTSFEETVNTLDAFKTALEKHAGQNRCLFNGQLQRPLKNESRAGYTKHAPREWLVFDFDKVEAKDAEDVVKRYLPPECQNVSYVSQLSASMFRPDATTWSGHIFMLLKDPITQDRLRQWFEYLNFSVPSLIGQIKLSDSLQALHWPLDRTVAYDSKLIYIAKPKCHGFQAAVEEHIALVRKRQTHLTIADFRPIDAIAIRQKINELRRNANLPDVSYDTVNYEGHELLRECEPGAIQGIKASGDHYLRFNLNGGDSYAYFIDLRNPEIIRNFKGEPYMLTQQVDENLYKSLRRIAPSVCAKAPLDDGDEVLAFYATNQNSAVKIGTYSPIQRALILHNSTETAARAWRAEYGLTQKEYLPHYDLVFDPTSDVQFLPGQTQINTFRITEHMARERTNPKASRMADMPPLMNKLIRSLLGNPEERVIEHFMNWLAFIFQKRQRTNTAWVFSGVEGTGKGSFIDYVLRPLFGAEHVAVIQYSNMRGEFNSYLENKLFVVVEEADINATDNANDAMAKLRLWITDEIIPLRKMHTGVQQMKNFCNFILSTNKTTPAQVSSTDRRFNFGERQNTRWIPTPNELVTLHGGHELEALADVLRRWPVDDHQSAMVIDTEAKRDAHEASTSINQLIAEAVSKGDLQFFIDRMPSKEEAFSAFHNRFDPLSIYQAKIDTFIAAATTGEEMVLGSDDLYILFRTLIPDPRFFQDSKTWCGRHYKSLGLDLGKQHRLPGAWNKRIKGIKVVWQLPEGAHVPSDDNVTPIKKGKRK